MSTAPSLARGIAGVIATALDGQNISARQASEHTGIPRSTLARRLSGHTPLTMDELEKLASLCGMSVLDITRAAHEQVAA